MEVYWNKRTFLHEKGSALSRLVLDPNIITETRQLIIVDRENANKWKMTERVPCGSFSWSLFLLGHPQHLTIIRRRIEFHATNNYFSVLNNSLSLTQLACNYLLWAGASEGRILIKFFRNWGGSNLFYSQPGEGHSQFLVRKKITPCRFYFVYTSKATSQD